MKKFFVAFASMLCTTVLYSQNEDSIVNTNVLFDIDIESQKEAFQTMQKGSDKNKAIAMADSILYYHINFYPPALYAASRVLYDAGRKYDAGFLFYLGQLRARVDMSLCLDNTVMNALVTLNKVYGASINNFCLQHKDSFVNIIAKVTDIVSSTEGNYDHRWIVLRGHFAGTKKFDDTVTNDDIIIPKSQWKEVKQIAIEAYKTHFLEFLSGKYN